MMCGEKMNRRSVTSVCIILIGWIIAGFFVFSDRGMMYAQSVFAVPLSLYMFIGPRLGYFGVVLGLIIVLLFWLWILSFYALLVWTAIDLFIVIFRQTNKRIRRVRAELLLLSSILCVGILLAHLDYSPITPSREKSFDIKHHFWLWPTMFLLGAAFLSKFIHIEERDQF